MVRWLLQRGSPLRAAINRSPEAFCGCGLLARYSRTKRYLISMVVVTGRPSS